MNLKMRENLFNQAKRWILKAGTFIRAKMNDPLIVTTKSNPKDLVTTVDKETEQFFVENIKHTYPDHLVLSEEGYGDTITSDDHTIWIIDPIDGTMNFVHQRKNFAI